MIHRATTKPDVQDARVVTHRTHPLPRHGRAAAGWTLDNTSGRAAIGPVRPGAADNDGEIEPQGAHLDVFVIDGKICCVEGQTILLRRPTSQGAGK